MKTKQLANVLIKILGLSVLVHSVPSVITGMFSMLRVRGSGSLLEYFVYPMSSVVMAGIGIYLILQSREVAEFLFKNDAE